MGHNSWKKHAERAHREAVWKWERAWAEEAKKQFIARNGYPPLDFDLDDFELDPPLDMEHPGEFNDRVPPWWNTEKSSPPRRPVEPSADELFGAFRDRENPDPPPRPRRMR